jgi:hypothetical protein
MRHVNKRCSYYCSIAEVDGKPEFVIEVEEAGHETLEFRQAYIKFNQFVVDSDPATLWIRIQEIRRR